MAEGNQSNTSKFTPNKVNPEQKDFILQQLAEGYKHEQVRQRLNEEYSLEVSIQTIKRLSSLEENRILEKRRALANQLDKIASSSKFIRVRELEEQRDRLRTVSDKDDESLDDKARERLILDNSEQRRKEMEGFKGVLSFDPDNPFTAVNTNLSDINKALEKLGTKKTVKKADELNDIDNIGKVTK